MHNRLNSFAKGIMAGMVIGAAITMATNPDMRYDYMRMMRKNADKAKNTIGRFMSNFR